MSIRPEIPSEPFMTPDQTAVLAKVALDNIEHHIEALPEGDIKATATHHAVRLHHHMTALLRLATNGGQVGGVTADSVGGDKPPGP